MNDFETVRDYVRAAAGFDQSKGEAALDRIEAEYARRGKALYDATNDLVMCEQGYPNVGDIKALQAEVEWLTAHSENLGTALLESRAEVERSRTALQSAWHEELGWRETVRAALGKEDRITGTVYPPGLRVPLPKEEA